MSARVSTITALAIPSLVGLTYLLLAGAPRSYLLVNATALLLSIALMAFGKPRVKRQHRLPILVVAVGLLFVPLFTGVAVNGIARWLPIGPVLLVRHGCAHALPHRQANRITPTIQIDGVRPMLVCRLGCSPFRGPWEPGGHAGTVRA